MLLRKIRTSFAARTLAMMISLEMLAQFFYPLKVHALTSGPTQPEVQNFQPVGTSDMVNVFTGDFSYNIPLLDVDGYPINISYASGIGTDQEASWVGLGWNINPGEISRSMRGIPDDFDGDNITKTLSMKPNRTYGVTVGAGLEIFGLSGLSLAYSISMNYNNYKGVGFEQSLNMQFSSGNSGKGSLTADLGITSGSDGISLTPSLSYAKTIGKSEGSDYKVTTGIGLPFNSRAGLKQMTLMASVSQTQSGVEESKANSNSQTYTYNGNASINFTAQTYTPQVSMSMINTSFTFSGKLGLTDFGIDGTANIGGYYSEQDLAQNTLNIPAYGYFNSQDGIYFPNAMHDVNREKDIPYTDATPDLPVTGYTYDVFSVNGQGIGGNYRAFRSDLGTVSDPAATTYSLSGNLGIEIASLNLVHAGVDVTLTDVTTTSGKWSGDDNASGALRFRSSVAGNNLYEPWYFKQAGEKAVDSDPSLFNTVGGDDPVKVSLQSGGSASMHVTATSTMNRQYANQSVSNISMPGSNYRSSRQRRNQPISFLRFRDSAFALQRNILDHTSSTMAAYSGAKGGHIGEITTLRSDGARYVYGLPAYNIFQKEVTFDVQGRSHDCGTGLVTYSSGDNSTSNNLGIDNYYSSMQTPAYAHSYLLTAIVSPDYVDYDGVQGPSKGDLGTYTKFNYTKVSSGFKWRTPVGHYSASFNEGFKSESSDDKGSYIYGEKEIWYLSSIETKNYIAVFTLSDRQDGFGVTDEDGSAGGDALKKLDRIDLYSKPDYDANGTNATPIKTVHFTYDYSLCPGVPNHVGGSQTGKLTLKTIYFTYQKSYKAKLSDYEFTYADNDQNDTAEANFGYNIKGYDRWGNYKRNPSSSGCGTTDSLTTGEFPYTDQDTALVNKYSAAWELTSIKLPSGGTIKIKYESDDYAYVQDRKADQMFKVCDAYYGSDNSSYTPSTTAAPQWKALMDINNSSNNYYLYFKLQHSISSSVGTTAAADTIYKKYLGENLTNIYFRFLVDITKFGDYEYVPGYADIDSYGVAPAVSGEFDEGWIKLKNAKLGDRSWSDDCNPICKAAWQFGRLNLPRKVWDQPDPQDNGIENTIKAMANSSFFGNIGDLFKGPNKSIRDKGYGIHAIMNKSWIRLNSPYGKKLGGGSRVKSIVIGDNWKVMTNNSGYTPNDAQYGQVYSYTTTDPSTGQLISSGVASYEPQLGGDENPFRQPVYFKEEKRLVPDDQSYIEEPFGEMFFPAPCVGYSRVTVSNIGYDNVSRHATGYTVQEFYTAKDFPTITRKTDMQMIHKRTNPTLALLRISMKDYVTASQGYVIELNDMHGKAKSQLVYAEGQTDPISEVHYYYKTSATNPKQLDNTIDVINKDGSVTQSQSGLDYDFVNDMREENSETKSGGIQTNVAGFLAAIFPMIVPTIYPTWNHEDTRFRSAVITKVINRYGILLRTDAHDAGSTVTTQNLAWDAETGELLVTKTKNDFDDPVYNFTYPAHWAYDHMGQAYKNLMTSFSKVTISSGAATVSSASDYFVPGDEVGVTKNSDGSHYKYWVCSVSGSSVNLIDNTGTAAAVSGTNGFTLQIIRSGRRNQQALAVGGVTLLTCPLVDTTGDGNYDAIQYDNVINAKSQEYGEHWMMFGGHVSPDYASCLCSNSAELDSLGSFLSTMVTDGQLLNDSVPLYDELRNSYRHNYDSLLNIPLPSSTDIYWFPNAERQLLNIHIAQCKTCTGCNLTLELPAPYTFDQVTALSNFLPITHPSVCGTETSYLFKATATLTNGEHVIVTGSSSCWSTNTDCEASGEITTCGKLPGNTVNPYYEDILGVWRPLRSSLYLADRKLTTGSGDVDTRKDGVFITKDHNTGSTISYQPFWNPNGGSDWTKDSTYWTWSSEVTMYTPFSNEVENRDALSRYSAAVYGYNNSLPIAVASNARYQEIAYDGFEDYGFVDSTNCMYQHFNFYAYRSHLSTTQAHTGLYSMKIGAGDSITATRPLTSYIALPAMNSCPYSLSDNDLIKTFSPITYNGDKVYVLNYWVREDTLTAPVFNYPDAKVKIKLTSSTGTTYPALTLVQKSDIIDGWQQYQYTFTIPAGTSGEIGVMLQNTGSAVAYFDDIRLHPFDSNMKSYVYNPVNMRFTSELDENNYATIYEYDEDGTLTRVKKETFNGIMTIKESRNNSSHN